MKAWKVELAEGWVQDIGGPGMSTWHIRLIAGNGEITLSSETYDSKSKAKRAAARLIKASQQGFTLKETT